MLPTGLSMLWEPAAPEAALLERFGFESMGEVRAWCSDILVGSWGVRVGDVTRAVISGQNAIVWASTDRGDVVVKWSRAREQFARLEASTELLRLVARRGVPVTKPLTSLSGRSRLVMEGPAGELSVAVLPELAGDWLDVGDAAAVRAAGACLAELHGALALIGQGRAFSADPPAPVPVPVPVSTIAATEEASVVEAATPTPAPAAEATAPAPASAAGAIRAGRLPAVAGSLSALATERVELRSLVTGWLAEGDRGQAPELSRRLAQLLASAPDLDDEPQLVHNDFRAANILTRDSKIAGVLDFDDVMVTHRVYDVAKASVYLGTVFTDWGPTAKGTRQLLRAGYDSVRALSPAEEHWLDLLTLWLGLLAAGAQQNPTRWLAAL